MKFAQQIVDFNRMYGLQVAPFPNVISVEQLRRFKKMLVDEVSELDDIIEAMEKGSDDMEILTMLADFTGDVQVYCASEMKKWGIPIENTLDIIMESNMSKLGVDGKPIVVAGKVQKGPNYWKPEPRLKEMLQKIRDVLIVPGVKVNKDGY